MIKYIKNYALIAAVAACATLTANAEVIEPAAYARSFTITFPGYSGSETLTDFPVLIKISPERNNFDYSACLVSNGGDLRFADADGNLLASEVDTWNTSGESLVWVKVPSFNKDTVITAYYGNANPDQITASEVWSNGYVGVWHLNESVLPLAESSGGSSPFTAGDKPEYANCGAVGIIGRAVDFDRDYTQSYGTPRLQSADDDGHLSGLTDFTVECWTYQTNYWNDGGVGAGILTKGNGADRSWRVYQANSADNYSYLELSDTSGVRMFANTDRAARSGEWTHQTFVRNKTVLDKCLLYFNGENVKNHDDTRSSIMSNTKPLVVGGGGESNSRVFPGSIDEVRISTVARSADWVKASHDCVTEEGFASFGVAESDNDWTQYSHRFKVSFSGYTGSETLENFPVLVKISESGISGFRYADCKKPGGADLRFADASGNLLASEVDTWDETGTSLIWVKVPSLTKGTRITAYYGWDFAPEVAASNVWANGYAGVWHLNESAVPLKESSGVSTPFMNTSANPTYTNKVTFAANGVAGKSVSFYDNYQNNAGIPRLEAADDPDLDGFNSFTVEYWTFPKGTWGDEADSGIVAKREASFNADVNASWCVQQNKSTFKSYCIWSTNSTIVIKAAATSNTMPALNTWNYQTFVRDVKSAEQANLQWYFNGAADGSKSEDNPQPVNSGHATLVLGGGKGPRVFPGSIDEVRISNVARSADWVKASHDTVMGSPFATYGSARKNADKGMIIILK